MEIQHDSNAKTGRFYVQENGEDLAEMTYTMAGPEIMIIDHTEVSDKLAGKGVGKQLVHHGVEFARTNHLKVIPLCPFAKGVFDKVAAYGDVLYKAN